MAMPALVFLYIISFKRRCAECKGPPSACSPRSAVNIRRYSGQLVLSARLETTDGKAHIVLRRFGFIRRVSKSAVVSISAQKTAKAAHSNLPRFSCYLVCFLRFRSALGKYAEMSSRLTRRYISAASSLVLGAQPQPKPSQNRMSSVPQNPANIMNTAAHADDAAGDGVGMGLKNSISFLSKRPLLNADSRLAKEGCGRVRRVITTN